MYLEYNWTACCYQPRFGDVFISINGFRSYQDMRQAVQELRVMGLDVGKKTASRTWEIVTLKA